MKWKKYRIIIAFIGFMIMLYGAGAGKGTPIGDCKSNCMRIISIGMFIMGFFFFPFGEEDTQDDSLKRQIRIARIWCWFWIVTGIILFLCSWVQP